MQAGNKTRRIWQRLRRSSSGSEASAASPIFEPFSYIPDLDMLVQVFPYDHQLPALPLLMAGPPPELEPLLLAWFKAGDWQTEEWEVETVGYLANSRATLQLTVRAQDEAARALAGLHLDRVTVPRHYHLWEEVRDLEEVGKQQQQACLRLESEIKEIVGDEVASLEEGPLVPTHRDLGPQDILI